jgi:glucose-1-phosphatase
MINTILFDVGGVLVQTVDTSKRGPWEEQLGLSKGQLTDEVYSIEPGELATIGWTTDEIMWGEIGKRFALSQQELDRMKEDFYEGDILNTEFFTYVESLVGRYQIALATNAWENARKVYTERYHLDKITKEMIISAEIGIQKPDPRFFELALGRLGVLAENTLFVDDTRENIIAAKELGIHTVLFKYTEQAIEDINTALRNNI